MEIFIAVVVVGAIAWIVSSRRKQDAQRREDLASWETSEREAPFLRTWNVHFPTMRMVVTFEATDHPEDEHVPREYVLSQKSSGWRMKLTDRSYRAELAQARELFETTAAGKTFGEARLRELEAGNKWQPMPPDAFAGLETAYQRYLRHG